MKVNLCAGLRPYLEACCGQAMGSVGKKRKAGGMKLRDNSTIADICEAFRCHTCAYISRVPDQNDTSQACYIIEIYQSCLEPLICKITITLKGAI